MDCYVIELGRRSTQIETTHWQRRFFLCVDSLALSAFTGTDPPSLKVDTLMTLENRVDPHSSCCCRCCCCLAFYREQTNQHRSARDAVKNKCKYRRKEDNTFCEANRVLSLRCCTDGRVTVPLSYNGEKTNRCVHHDAIDGHC